MLPDLILGFAAGLAASLAGGLLWEARVRFRRTPAK